jgi:hypothetical protein
VALLGTGLEARHWEGVMTTDHGDITWSFDCWLPAPRGPADPIDFPCGRFNLFGSGSEYNGLFSFGFEIPSYPSSCNPFLWTGYDIISGPDCGDGAATFTIFG